MPGYFIVTSLPRNPETNYIIILVLIFHRCLNMIRRRRCWERTFRTFKILKHAIVRIQLMHMLRTAEHPITVDSPLSGCSQLTQHGTGCSFRLSHHGTGCRALIRSKLTYHGSGYCWRLPTACCQRWAHVAFVQRQRQLVQQLEERSD